MKIYKKRRFKAILFATDGGWITDYPGSTRDEVIEQLANKGSEWYFFPFEGIILDKGRGGVAISNQRLLDVAPNLPQELVGKSIKTVSRWLASLSDDELYELLSN